MSSSSASNNLRVEHDVISKTKSRFRRFRDSISPNRHGKQEQEPSKAVSQRDHGVSILQVAITPAHADDEVCCSMPAMKLSLYHSASINVFQLFTQSL